MLAFKNAFCRRFKVHDLHFLARSVLLLCVCHIGKYHFIFFSAILACFTSNALFDSLLVQFMAAVENAKKPQEKRIPIQVIGGISRSAGWRAGKHLDRLVPLLIGSVRHLSDESADEEIREMCIEVC